MRPRPSDRHGHRSLHVLNLLAELLDHGLQVEPDPRQGDVVGLGAERVGLAAEFLRQEVEPAADRPPSSEAAGEPPTWARSRSSSSRMSARAAISTASWCRRAGSRRPCRREAARSAPRAGRGSLRAAGRRGLRLVDEPLDRVELLPQDAGERLPFAAAAPSSARSSGPIAAARSSASGGLVLARIARLLLDLDHASHGQQAVDGGGARRRWHLERADGARSDCRTSWLTRTFGVVALRQRG